MIGHVVSPTDFPARAPAPALASPWRGRELDQRHAHPPSRRGHRLWGMQAGHRPQQRKRSSRIRVSHTRAAYWRERYEHGAGWSLGEPLARQRGVNRRKRGEPVRRPGRSSDEHRGCRARVSVGESTSLRPLGPSRLEPRLVCPSGGGAESLTERAQRADHPLAPLLGSACLRPCRTSVFHMDCFKCSKVRLQLAQFAQVRH